jgi:hypothetical protein
VAGSGSVATSSGLVLESSLVVNVGFECSLDHGSTSDLQRPPIAEKWVVGYAPSPWNGCAAPIAEKGAIIWLDGMTHSQKWPVGFGPSG